MTIFGITISVAILWLIVAAIFGIIEAFTLGLTTIWFTGGAIAAAVAAMAGFSPLVQIIVFLVVSSILIIFTRPLAKKKLKIGSEKTNVDALEGKEALITVAIEPFQAGQAKVDGLIWTAVGLDQNTAFEKGTMVKIDHVEGVKLVVAPLGNKD